MTRSRTRTELARFTSLLALLGTITLLFGCLSYQALPNADWSRIESGDDVRVTMRAGEVHELEVQHRDDRGIRGDDIELAFDDILQIERHESALATHQWVLLVGSLIFLGIGLSNFHL